MILAIPVAKAIRLAAEDDACKNPCMSPFQRDDQTFSVLVLDMAHSHDPDAEQTVPGFATVAAARAYAEARTRASVEELRGEGKSASDIRSLWHIYGEDCLVIGDTFAGRTDLDLYIAIPADASALDWRALTPKLKRFHAALLFSDANNVSVWAGGFLYRYVKPSRATLMAIFRAQALEAFARKGHPDAAPVDLHVGHLFEIFDPPAPPPGLPLHHWRVDVDFVCHDVKFGSRASGVFAWPEQPSGDVLDAMARVLMGDSLTVRGDGPDWANVSETRLVKIEATSDTLDYPLRPSETSIPATP